MNLTNIFQYLPEIKDPSQRRLDFNTKLKWTLIILFAFFIMSNIELYGADPGFLERFEFLSVIIGAKFGSIIALGIGPIVMGSIILQLLVGSGILEIDTATKEGRQYFQGLQKLLVLFFIVFEAVVYVVMGGIRASPGFEYVVILQLILGGLAILFMDEICHKWGFGSGVSLFIAAGVGWRLMSSSFSFLGPEGNFQATGKVLAFIVSLKNGDPQGAMLSFIAIASTIILFLIIVWAQSLKIEVPLSYDRLRGYALKWPLQFFYTSVIPIILIGALTVNLNVFGALLQNWLGKPTFLGNFVNGQPVSGFMYWIQARNLLEQVIQQGWSITLLWKAIGHILFYSSLSALFSLFWMKTSGMDAQSQAENILKSGLQIPGFRKDRRILESVLSRYILPLTIMGGIAIGLLAALADIMGSLVGGTSLLLGIMIAYQFYESIAREHAIDMNPMLKKMIK